MEIIKGIEIIDLALYIKKEKALIITDTHIGYESELNDKGIMVPRLQFTTLIKKLEKILKKVKPNKIIINGDVKHQFGRISTLEWRNTRKLIDFLRKKSELIFIKGNHDKVLAGVGKKLDVTVKDKLKLGTILITHGDTVKRADKSIKTIIIGHEHPAITLKEGARKEKYKCYLKGKYKDKTLIVQPSLNLLTEGTEIPGALICTVSLTRMNSGAGLLTICASAKALPPWARCRQSMTSNPPLTG